MTYNFSPLRVIDDPVTTARCALSQILMEQDKHLDAIIVDGKQLDEPPFIKRLEDHFVVKI